MQTRKYTSLLFMFKGDWTCLENGYAASFVRWWIVRGRHVDRGLPPSGVFFIVFAGFSVNGSIPIVFATKQQMISFMKLRMAVQIAPWLLVELEWEKTRLSFSFDPTPLVSSLSLLGHPYDLNPCSLKPFCQLHLLLYYSRQVLTSSSFQANLSNPVQTLLTQTMSTKLHSTPS